MQFNELILPNTNNRVFLWQCPSDPSQLSCPCPKTDDIPLNRSQAPFHMPIASDDMKCIIDLSQLTFTCSK